MKLNAHEIATDRWENEGGRIKRHDRSKGENVKAWFVENWFWLLIFGAFVSITVALVIGRKTMNGGARRTLRRFE